MRVLRALGGARLGILASVVGLVAALRCATVVLPPAATHPVKASGATASAGLKTVAEGVGDRLGKLPRPDQRSTRMHIT